MSHKLRTSPHSTLSVSSTNLISKQKQIGFQFFEAIPFFIFYRNIFKQKFYILSSIPWNHNNINSFLKLFQIVLSHKHCLLKKDLIPKSLWKCKQNLIPLKCKWFHSKWTNELSSLTCSGSWGAAVSSTMNVSSSSSSESLPPSTITLDGLPLPSLQTQTHN